MKRIKRPQKVDQEGAVPSVINPQILCGKKRTRKP